MANHEIFTTKQEVFLDYLIQRSKKQDNHSFSIDEVSEDLGISSASVRELLEMAKSIGLIRIQPRTGIQILPYRFTPAVIKSLYAAVRMDRSYFNQFFDLRNHIERAYFLESAANLPCERMTDLLDITERARKLLEGSQPRIPHDEHRKFHLTIYRDLDNAFAKGILEAYWDIYEMAGLNLYEDLAYLKKVWQYHESIAEKINSGKFEEAYLQLIEHMELIYQR